MNRQIILTEDGSSSFFVPELNEQYHSVHGAIQESTHVFIEAGLKQCLKNEITVLEVGIGTGLNAFLTLIHAEKTKQKIKYIGIEKYPLTPDEYHSLNYAELLSPEKSNVFEKIHSSDWETEIPITPTFSVHKIKADLRYFNTPPLPFFDVIYFDAFAPNKQPDLWQESVYKKIYEQANPGAIFVTYCAKGVVRRELTQSGFSVERIPGPPGKKEMLRATK